MLERLYRLLVGVFLIVSFPVTIPVSLVIWIFTDKFHFMNILEWCITGEWCD
jgi:hypothetical protein